MGNLVNTIKKFIANKNTVTILGVLAGVVVLWGFYTWRVKDATNPIEVPYALHAIPAQQQITQEDIGYMTVNGDVLKKAKVYTRTTVNQLIGKYVNVGTSIPEGGMFYLTQIVEKKELPNSIFSLIPAGYTIYQLKVDNNSTYGNSIYPGDKIDLYISYKENGTLTDAKFIENIEVLAVRDSSGQNVFDDSSKRSPALLLFAVDNKYFSYLQASGKIGGTTVYPVPRGGSAEDMGDLQMPNQTVLDYIEAHAFISTDDEE